MGKNHFNINFEEEEILWTDKKRLLPFGIPWTFTRYSMTPTTVTITTGIFGKKEENINLYKVTDITQRRSFFERLCKTGTLCIISADVSSPEAHLVHIKESNKVKQLIQRFVDEEKRNKNIIMTERNSPLPSEVHDFQCSRNDG